jgi:hypothetical protein
MEDNRVVEVRRDHRSSFAISSIIKKQNQSRTSLEVKSSVGETAVRQTANRDKPRAETKGKQKEKMEKM